MRAKNKILSVRIEHKTDESPDYSHLGKLTQTPDCGAWYFHRPTGELRDGETVLASNVWTNYSRHEYEFIDGFQHGGSDSSWGHVSDADVCKAWLRVRYKANGNEMGMRGNLFEKYHVRGWTTAQSRADKIRCLDIVYCCLECYRLERLFNGDWNYMGVIAKAEYVSGNQVTQTIRSGGLWGIETDSGGDYIKQVEDEQLSELRKELESVGFSPRAITRAFQNKETVNH